MKRDIILAGVGGQGILTAAKLIYTAASREGLNMKQTEVHGMSQRGGSVESHIRISDGEIHSALIPEGACDLIIATDPLESLRYVRFLAADGAMVVNKTPFKNIADYPAEDFITAELGKLAGSLTGPVHVVDPAAMAKEAGSAYAQNAALLGAACGLTGLKPESFRAAIAEVFAGKGDNVIAINTVAFDLGLRSLQPA
ncbi:MAG: indolepyruvate oxidoreductase subunit beta [Elusimicrobiota bacterium]